MYLGAVRALLQSALISPNAFRRCLFQSLRRRANRLGDRYHFAR